MELVRATVVSKYLRAATHKWEALERWISRYPRATKHKLEGSEQLCAICREVNLPELLGSRCGNNTPWPHWHLGDFEAIQAKRKCPFCRLVSSIHHTLSTTSRDPIVEASSLSATLYAEGMAGAFAATEDERGTDYADRYADHFAAVVEFTYENGGAEHRLSTRNEFHVIRQCVKEGATALELAQDFDNMKCGQILGHGRMMQPRQIEFPKIQAWLACCEKSHGGECKGVPTHDALRSVRRIRLIDVKERRIVQSTTDNRYLALSYVWGVGVQISMNKSDLNRFCKSRGLLDSDLPKTIKDAIYLTEQLNERYLWIDRLCILFDDEQDKFEHMSYMYEIYRCATLTVIVSSASSSLDPIPDVQPGTRNPMQHSEIINGVRYITSQPNVVSAVRHQPRCTRGWTFQEAFLPPRCIVFTPYQAYFQCMTELWCEDSVEMPLQAQNALEVAPNFGNIACGLFNFILDNQIRCNFY